MSFKKSQIPLQLAPASNPVKSVPFNLPPCKTFTLQFLFNLASSDPTSVKLEQSSNGSHFDEISDLGSFALDPSDSSFSLTVSGLLTIWLRLSVTFPADETGSISSVNLLTF